MDVADYISAVSADSEALAVAAGDLSVRVPSCPEWVMADLVWHVGEIHNFWRQIVEGRLQTYKEAERTTRPSDDQLVAWFRAGATRLVDVLTAGDPNNSVWTWSRQKNVAFVQRRIAQETAVHRWDAQNAAETATPIDGNLAADGIDEFLTIWAPMEKKPLGGGGETLHLHRTDGDGEWLVRLNEGGIDVTSAHEKADVAVRGSASDLLLMMWRRREASALEVLGDESVLEKFLAWMELT